MPHGKGTLWRDKHTWEDNIKMDLKEVMYEGGVIQLWPQVGLCEHDNRSLCSTEGGKFLGQLSKQEPPSKNSATR